MAFDGAFVMTRDKGRLIEAVELKVESRRKRNEDEKACGLKE